MSEAELVASPDELDALAFGLAGSGFPGLGPTLVTGAREADRGRVARRLAVPLLARGVLDADGPMWTVADRYRGLLSAVLEPDLAVCVHVRMGGSAGTAIACARGGNVAVHAADPAGWHRLAMRDADLAATVWELLGVPADRPEADRPEADRPEADRPEADRPGAAGDRPWVRVRYSTLMRGLAGAGPVPVAAAPLADLLRAHDYVAKLTLLGHRSGTYQARSLATVRAPNAPLWTMEVEPDGEDDGWIVASAVTVAGLRAAVDGLCAGTGREWA